MIDTVSISSNSCPYCRSTEHTYWATELGYSVHRCNKCRILFVYPMPTPEDTDKAVRTGLHKQNSLNLNVKSRRHPAKIKAYRNAIGAMFPELQNAKEPITWVDVGSGYGETLQAVLSLAPSGSTVIGVEPMKHKADAAASLGLSVVNDYLAPDKFKADVISLIDIYSHVPDFWKLLANIKSNLKAGGVLLLESGNLADLENRSEFFGELGLPDHLVFAGETHLVGYLESSGFEIHSIQRQRFDGFVNLLKAIVKKMLGRSVNLSVPYTSKYRQIRLKAILKSS